MASISSDLPLVQPFAALLHHSGDAGIEEAIVDLEGLWSPVAMRGRTHPFDRTDYYEPEMGTGLQRTLVAFRDTVDPTWLIEAKHAASKVEDRLRIDGKRQVNIDVGYLDLFKVVLASWKERGHKLYLGEGVWADITLTFGKGAFRPLEWTFPDFRTGVYDLELHTMRDAYKVKLQGKVIGEEEGSS